MKWVVIVIILLIVFGSKKIPDLGKGLGEGIKSFKDVFKGADDPPSKPDPGKRS
jgi:sec-independent protein translocase protein TatA